jgi:lipid-binding SYLF domain-containing protein
MLRSLRVALLALAATLAASAPALADTCSVRIKFVKAGWVIGGTVGSGTLTCGGRSYPLSIGGLSYGFTFGVSSVNLRGTARNVYRPSDIEGVYGAGSAGAAVVRGPQAAVLSNQKGVVLSVAGEQSGLIINIDLSGMAVSLSR